LGVRTCNAVGLPGVGTSLEVETGWTCTVLISIGFAIEPGTGFAAGRGVSFAVGRGTGLSVGTGDDFGVVRGTGLGVRTGYAVGLSHELEPASKSEPPGRAPY
jgi:hypothetical protein